MPPSPRAVARFSLCALLFAAGAPRAQERPSLEATPEEVTGTRLRGSLLAPEAQSTVIDAARFGGELRSVSELLATAPGVSVHGTGGPLDFTTVSLRGASSDQSLVLLDGIPLQGPFGGALDLSTLPVSLLDRLVVSRGVLGAQLGAGALGGAIEIVPRRAQPGTNGGAQLAAGSFGTAQLAGDVASQLGGGRLLAAVQLDRTQGDFGYRRQLTPNLADAPWYDFSRQNADATRGGALLRFSQPLAAGTELDLLAQGSAGERGIAGSWTAPTARARELDGEGLFGARLRGSAGGAPWALRAWGRLDGLELRGLAPSGDCADGASDCPREREFSGAVHTEGEISYGLGEAQVATLRASAGRESIRGTSTGDHARSLVALGLDDQISLPGAIVLHPAVRLDAIGGAAGLSPGLAATWRPDPQGPWELRSGAGLSFRAPTFSELYLDTGVTLPNPGLRPERALSLDAGIAWRGRAVLLSAGAFWSAYRDLIVYELYPPQRSRPANAGRSHIAGLELEAVVPLPAGLLAEASYSWLAAVNDRSGAEEGHELPYRPRHRLFARLAHRSARFEGYAEASFTSGVSLNSVGTARLGPQLALNAGAGVRAVGPLWLDLEAKNLLDDRTREDLFQYPLPGFSLALLARARF